ncbi:hypothetical protein Q8A73_014723 [Channa argus]|nr:hypothetical protein Q8A73_014723 [Channa argus]
METENDDGEQLNCFLFAAPLLSAQALNVNNISYTTFEPDAVLEQRKLVRSEQAHLLSAYPHLTATLFGLIRHSSLLLSFVSSAEPQMSHMESWTASSTSSVPSSLLFLHTSSGPAGLCPDTSFRELKGQQRLGQASIIEE